MRHFFLLQASGNGQIPYYLHIAIISLIMIAAGLLGGYTGYLIEKNRMIQSGLSKDMDNNLRKEKKYFLITGLCASLLIPLFLSTISSQLMNDSQKEPLKYFVLGGFCLLVAIFSKQFISSLSEKILKQVEEKVQQQTTEKVEKAFDEKKGFISQQVEKEVTLQTTPFQTRISVSEKVTALESQLKNPNNTKQLTLTDLTGLLDEAIQTGDPQLPSQIYDRLSILCYDLQQYELLEKIAELYKDKIKLTPYSWADLAISNMNSYSAKGNVSYKTKSEEYASKSLEALPDYGVPYMLRLYLLLIEYKNLPKDDPKLNELMEKMKDIFKQIINSGKVTAKEAYDYFKLNDTTSFSGYNQELKDLLPEEWKSLEQKIANN